MTARPTKAARRRNSRDGAQPGQIRVLTEELAAIDLEALEPWAEPDRAELLHCTAAIRTTLKTIQAEADRAHSVPRVFVIAYLSRAAAQVGAAIGARHLGAHPFPMFFQAATYLGMALQANREAAERSSKASPRTAASRRLRELARQHPDMTAAALRRMLETEAGGVMDDSAARAVVRAMRRASE